MSDFDAQLALAAQMLRHSPRNAVEQIREVLAEEPAHADAHALLSVALLRNKRIYAAEHEAREALRLEPTLAQAHCALGAALMAQRNLTGAEASLTEAVAQSPNRSSFRMVLAELREVQGRRDEALELLNRAIALDPEDAGAHAAKGKLLMELGRLDEAEKCADAAAELEPGAIDTLVLQGHIALRRGRPDEASDFALWALSSDADDSDALGLLVDVKARKSWVLGLWWRYIVWMVKKSDRGQIVTLIAAYLLVQISAQAAADLKYPDVSSAIQIVWLGLVAYSFIAPGFYRRLLEKEQRKVQLRADF